MSWKNNRERHSAAARGISTKDNKKYGKYTQDITELGYVTLLNMAPGEKVNTYELKMLLINAQKNGLEQIELDMDDFGNVLIKAYPKKLTSKGIISKNKVKAPDNKEYEIYVVEYRSGYESGEGEELNYPYAVMIRFIGQYNIRDKEIIEEWSSYKNLDWANESAKELTNEIKTTGLPWQLKR